MKKLLVLLAVSLMAITLSAKELTDSKYQEYLDCMEFLGNKKLDGQIGETILLENQVEPKLIYQVFFDSDTQMATVKVSNLVLHEYLMKLRGITSEQFTERVIQFYLNSEIPENDGTILYKLGRY